MGELSNLLCFCYNQADRRKERERVIQMFKRGLCFLTAAVFLLLLAPVPGHACEHYGPDTPKSKLVRKGYVEPQVGVPGYTGDYHCPVCDAIVIKGKPLAAADDEVCVFHTLVISPRAAGKGYGTAFMRFYEEYATAHGCTELRIDTNARNERARAIYRKLGYQEIATVPTVFNGIEGVRLVLLEKTL